MKYPHPATNLEHLTFLHQFGQTQRYHTEVTLKTQDVGQHSYNVALVAWYLWGGTGEDSSSLLRLLQASLLHDAGERATGDLPAPTKRAMSIGKGLEHLEAAHLRTGGWGIPPLTELEAYILKAADTIEGLLFNLRELELGNQTVINPRRNGSANVYLSYLHDQLEEFPEGAPLGLRSKLADVLQAFTKEFSHYVFR